MHILFITSEFLTRDGQIEHGGLANYLARLAPELVKAGHDVTVLVFGKESFQFKYKDVNVVALKQPVLPRERRGWRWIGAILQRLVWKCPFALNFFYATYCLLCGVWEKAFYHSLARSVNDAILVLHESSPIDIIQYANFSAAGLEQFPGIPACVRISSNTRRYEEVSPSYRLALRYHIHEEEKFLKNFIGLIFGPADHTNRSLEKDLRLAPASIKTIETLFYNELEIQDDKLLQALYRKGIKKNGFFLFFGKLTKMKGYVDCLHAISLLAGKYTDVHFVFVGDSNILVEGEGLKPKTLAHQLLPGAFNRLHFTGLLNHEALYPLIKAARACLIPSWVDNFPNTALEVMGLGGLLIGTPEAGLAQLLVCGENGFLCRSKDPKSLAEKIEKVLQLPVEDLARLKEAAQKRVEQNAPDRIIKQLVDFYKSTIHAQRS